MVSRSIPHGCCTLVKLPAESWTGCTVLAFAGRVVHLAWGEGQWHWCSCGGLHSAPAFMHMFLLAFANICEPTGIYVSQQLYWTVVQNYRKYTILAVCHAATFRGSVTQENKHACSEPLPMMHYLNHLAR